MRIQLPLKDNNDNNKINYVLGLYLLGFAALQQNMSIASWITFKADSLDVTSYSLTILAHHFIKSLVEVNLPFLFKLNIASLS